MKPKFKRGFKKKTINETIEILKKSIKKKINTPNKIFVNLLKQFNSISEPTHELDWLAQYNEQGQTCIDFLQSCPIDEKQELFIYYIQIDEFKETKLDFNKLIEYSRLFFDQKSIKIMPFKIEIEKKVLKTNEKYILNASYGNECISLEHRSDLSTNHSQIKATSIFRLLKKIKPKDAYCLIAFTEFDLFLDESDLFVAGLCDGRSRVGAFSCFRYNPIMKYSEEYWYKLKRIKLKKSEQNLLLTRSCKLLAHETCHLLGIDHCIFMDCCMNGSGHLEEDFRQSMFLCPIDLKKLTLIFNFNLINRYEKMKSFFEIISANKEVKWLDNAIKLIKKNS